MFLFGYVATFGGRGPIALTFFLSACPFFRSLFAMITPTRRVSNTGSLRLAAASGMRGERHYSAGLGGGDLSFIGTCRGPECREELAG